ncbi:outer membrane protein assembly factor BamC [Marinobacterium sp. YM272]|uniref:outer membrane protein assembly factor BamC n=1 Tax=Marinobacterium sp. YM272 TaxID=3421654 RepID=UPI003D7F3FED
MIRKNSYSLLALGIASVLGGCSALENNPIYGDNAIVRDRGQDYELAQPAERLVIPPGMAAREMEDQLVVPKAGMTASVSQGEFEVPRPEFFYVESGSEKVNMKRLDGERVIVVDEPIADVWVKLKEFWSFNDIDLSLSDPRQGVMETEWITLDGDDYNFVDAWLKRLTFQDIEGASRNKLRVVLRPDPEDYQRTSVRMQHAGFPAEQEVSAIDWDNQSQDVEYKSDMMFEMLRYLSKASEPDSQSLLALQEQTRDNPQVGRDSRGNPVLKLGAPIDQAWTQLNAAVDAAELDVGTRDQGTGMIYLTYTTLTRVDDTERMGFFEWLNSDREDITFDANFLGGALGGDADEDAPDAIRYSSGKTAAGDEVQADVAADLADPNNLANQEGYKIWFGGKVIYVFGGGDSGVYNEDTGNYEHTGRYQLKMNRTRNGVFLSVLTDQGLEAPDVVAEEILWDIKDHLPES